MNPAQRRSFVTRLKTSRGPSFDLLVQLDRHRVLTTGQVARLMAAPARTTSYRLDRLQQAGMVDCARPGREAGSAPRHWWLTLAGARLVSGTAPAEGKKPSAFFAAHTSAIAELWLSLLEHGPAAGITPTRWRPDRAGWSALPTTGPGSQKSLTPDGVLLADLTMPDGQNSGAWPTAALFEVDLNTETQKGLGGKLARYLQYAADRLWAAQGLPHCPPLLLLTTSKARAATWLRTAAKAGARHHRRQGLDYRFTGRAAARRDITAAERLVIAACGLVHNPAAAVSEPVWLLADDSDDVAAQPVTLAQLLAERVTTGRVADRWYDRLTAEADTAARASTLWDIGRDNRLGELLGDAHAGEALPRLISNRPGEFATAHPRLAGQLLDWWPHRHDGQAHTTLAEIRAVLVDEHTRIWTTQVRQVLAAGRHPKVAASAARLQDGRLLDDYPLSLLADGPDPGHVATHQQQRGWYVAAREQAVTATWQALPWRTRRRTDRDVLAAAYDDEQLLVCELCAGTAFRRPPADPAVTEPWDCGGNNKTEPGDHCPHCSTGRLLTYTDRHQVPRLSARLDDLRARLTADARPKGSNRGVTTPWPAR